VLGVRAAELPAHLWGDPVDASHRARGSYVSTASGKRVGPCRRFAAVRLRARVRAPARQGSHRDPPGTGARRPQSPHRPRLRAQVQRARSYCLACSAFAAWTSAGLARFQARILAAHPRHIRPGFPAGWGALPHRTHRPAATSRARRSPPRRRLRALSACRAASPLRALLVLASWAPLCRHRGQFHVEPYQGSPQRAQRCSARLRRMVLVDEAQRASGRRGRCPLTGWPRGGGRRGPALAGAPALPGSGGRRGRGLHAARPGGSAGARPAASARPWSRPLRRRR